MTRAHPRLGLPDTRCTFLGAVACIVVVAVTPPGYWTRLAVEMVLVCLALAALRTPLRWLLGRALLLLPFVLIALFSVPFVHTARDPFTPYQRAGTVLLRMAVSFGALAALFRATNEATLLEALGRLRVPPIIVTLMALILRYLEVLGEEASRMLRARDARGMPPSLRSRAQMAGSMVGTLFVRSFERSERVSAAMRARGFTGLLPAPGVRPLTVKDWVCLIGLVTVQGLLLLLH